GDQLTRFVRRGRATRRAGGRAADLLGVLRAAAAKARTHPATGRSAERRARSPATGRAALLLLLTALVRRELACLERRLVVHRTGRWTRRGARREPGSARGATERLAEIGRASGRERGARGGA